MLFKRTESQPVSRIYFMTIIIATTDDIGSKVCNDVFRARKAFYLWSIYIYIYE